MARQREGRALIGNAGAFTNIFHPRLASVARAATSASWIEIVESFSRVYKELDLGQESISSELQTKANKHQAQKISQTQSSHQTANLHTQPKSKCRRLS
jgi:hypothetical protein